MKVKCPNCEKSQNGKVISNWTRKLVKKNYRDPRYMLDDDGDSYDLVGYGKYVVLQKYHRVVLPLHKRGLVKRHRCQGSGRKMIVRGTSRKITK